jgi:hypothetical protein
LGKSPAFLTGSCFEVFVDTLVKPFERLAQGVFRGAETALGQAAERHQVVLKVAVVVPIEGELRAGDEGDGVEVSDVGLSHLVDAALVGCGIVAGIDQTLEVFQNGQQNDGDGGEALLAIDDVKGLVIGGLEDEVTHVVSAFPMGLERALDIHPQILPFVLGPCVVPLEAGDTVSEAVAEELPEGVAFGFEIGGGHDVSRRDRREGRCFSRR